MEGGILGRMFQNLQSRKWAFISPLRGKSKKVAISCQSRVQTSDLSTALFSGSRVSC